MCSTASKPRALRAVHWAVAATSAAMILAVSLQAAEKTDRVVMMGVNRRGDPSWQTAQRALASGQIGHVRQLNAYVFLDNRIFREEQPIAQPILQSLEGSELMKAMMLDIPKPGSWRRDPAQIGGDFFADIGSHLVDVMLWLGGAPACEVLAYQPKDRPPQASILTLQALLRNDTILSITFNDNIAMGDDFTFAGDGHLNVFGDRGRLIAASIGWGAGPAVGSVLARGVFAANPWIWAAACMGFNGLMVCALRTLFGTSFGKAIVAAGAIFWALWRLGAQTQWATPERINDGSMKAIGVSLLDLLILYAYGKPDWRPMLVGYLGLLLQAGCLLAIGTFISSCTKNQIVAGVAGFSG